MVHEIYRYAAVPPTLSWFRTHCHIERSQDSSPYTIPGTPCDFRQFFITLSSAEELAVKCLIISDSDDVNLRKMVPSVRKTGENLMMGRTYEGTNEIKPVLNPYFYIDIAEMVFHRLLNNLKFL